MGKGVTYLYLFEKLQILKTQQITALLTGILGFISWKPDVMFHWKCCFSLFSNSFIENGSNINIDFDIIEF